MPFGIFFRILVLVMCTGAVSAYAASLSILKAVVVTLAASLLLQVTYFASLLFLCWWSGRAHSDHQRSTHSPPGQAAIQPQEHKQAETEHSNVLQLHPRRDHRLP